METKRVFHSASLVWVFLSLVLLLFQLRPLHGWMGHDYYHYFARILIGVEHFFQNGMGVPHFTARLCGGIPFFADPQSIYYSVPQVLSFLLDPLFSTQATYVLFYLLGVAGMVKLLGSLGVSKPVSHFGGLLFLWNGFSFAHFLVGHMTHHSFLLAPWWLWAWYEGSRRKGIEYWKCVALFSGVFVYTFYSGGFHILVVFLFMFLLFLIPVAQKYHGCGCLKFLAWSGLIGFFATSGKLFALARYAPHFIEQGVDAPSISLLAILKYHFWFLPSETPEALSFGRTRYGSWEYVQFTSKLTLPFLLFALLRGFKRNLVFFLGLAAVSCVTTWFAMGGASASSLLFFNRYHNPGKIFAAFLPGLIVLTALGIDFLYRRKQISVALLAVFSLFVVVEGFSYTLFFTRQTHIRNFHYEPRIYQSLRNERIFPPVTVIRNNLKEDMSQLALGSCSQGCYEPLFGYRREKLFARNEIGGASLTHPGCLLYGKELGCEPWTLIPSNSKEGELFRSGKSVAAWVPGWQKVLFTTNLIAVALLFLPWAVVPFYGFKTFRKFGYAKAT